MGIQIKNELLPFVPTRNNFPNMTHHHNHDEFRLHTHEFNKLNDKLDRRHFLTKTSLGLGALAVGSLFGANKLFGAGAGRTVSRQPGELSEDSQEAILRALPHFAPKAKRVVYLFMSGGPSQLETFDYKPKLNDMFAKDLPDSVRKGAVNGHECQPKQSANCAFVLQVCPTRKVPNLG